MVAAAVTACFVGSPAWPSTGTGVANVAHRGASRAAPENTVASVVRAVADRADIVELDVRLTGDGVPVLLHDASLARTTDVETQFPDRAPWLVGDFSLEEVRRLDAGTWKSGTYAGERVATLDEALAQLSQSPAGVFIEVKDPDAYGWVGGIGATVFGAVVSRWPTAWDGSDTRRVVVQSADARFVEDFAAAYPEVPVGVIQTTLSPDSLPSFADDVEVDQAGLTPERVVAAQAAGLTVGAWTVNDPATMGVLAETVDSITTNDPWRLREVLVVRAATYTRTVWPTADATPPRWSLTTRGQYRGTPVVVEAELDKAAAGGPAAWQRAAVQRWSDGRWLTVAVRGTDAAGRLTAVIAGRADLVVRVVSLDDLTYPLVVSPAQPVPLEKVSTDLRLGGTRRVAPRGAARLTVRWRAAEGRLMSGKAKLLKRHRGEPWRYVRDLTVVDGYVRTTVRPGRRTTFYRARGRATWWRSGAVDDTRVVVVD